MSILIRQHLATVKPCQLGSVKFSKIPKISQE
uniref:Uncharacterized protein n=1 Tax=Siphoviridae sp. ctiJm4 TaxID=2827916 RepID=A0A8S5T1Q3_9CAUD|nr:MAG TPA: hypothetical protein [Siphoviridae sp. ctiJm4]